MKAIVCILRRWRDNALAVLLWWRDNALAVLLLVGIGTLIAGALLWQVLKFMAVCKWLFH